MTSPDSAVPWLTIVTVVRDDEPGFARSAASLLLQDLTGVDWVIVDSSHDRQAVPASIPTALSEMARYRWTPPAGVYPAMNAGLELAEGEYLYFLNAGDELAGPGALTSVREATTHRAEWMYGQATFVAGSGRRVTPPPFDYRREKAALFSRGRFPPHQATVARTATVRALRGFDTTYRITADYALMLALADLSDPVEIRDVIAVFHEGGISSLEWQESLREFHRARVEVLAPAGVTAVREWLGTGSQWTRMLLGRSRDKLRR